MQRLLFDYIYSQKLTGNNLLKINLYNEDQIINLINKFLELVETNHEYNVENQLSFVANQQLSGEIYPCSGLDCRLGNIQQLAPIASLYADVIWIKNPFEKYLKYKRFDDDIIKFHLIGDIAVLQALKPLIESEIIKFVDSNVHFCTDCLKKYLAISPKEFSNRSEKIWDSLMKRIVSGADYKFELGKNSGYEYIKVTPKTDGIFCKGGEMIRFSDGLLPESLQKIKERKSKKIYKNELKKSYLCHHITESLYDDIIMQDWYCNKYKANYLSNREIDFELISEITKDVDEKKKIGIMNKSLNHILPVIKNASLEQVLSLRKNEGEAFYNYRSAINKFTKSNYELNDSRFKEAFYDEVYPHINDINLTIKRNQKSIFGDIGKNLVLGSLVVSLFNFGGFLPVALKNTIAGLGAFHSTNDFISNVKKLIQKDLAAKENNYYFIWKLMK